VRNFIKDSSGDVLQRQAAAAAAAAAWRIEGLTVVARVEATGCSDVLTVYCRYENSQCCVGWRQWSTTPPCIISGSNVFRLLYVFVSLFERNRRCPLKISRW